MSSERIKVLHFGLGANRGGIETYLYKLASGIDRSKFSFSFIDTSKATPCFYQELIDLGCRFYKITPRKSSILRNKKDLERLFKEHHFDIFHCHINTLSYIEPIVVALHHNVKVIVHSRNAGTSGSKITRLLHLLNSFRLPKNITCISVSTLAGDWLFGKSTEFKVYNNGVDLEVFRFDQFSRASIREALGVSQNDFLVGHVGAFLPAKNQTFVIDVFNEIIKIRPESKLVMVGDGVLIGRSIQRVRQLRLLEHVHFTGKREDISSMLSAMDLFLFPSFYEGFPNAVLEAQATGLPCLVSTNVTDEVIIQGNSRRIPLDLDASSWARHAINLMGVSVDRSSAHHAIADAGFSVEAELARVEELYLSVLNNRPLP